MVCQGLAGMFSTTLVTQPALLPVVRSRSYYVVDATVETTVGEESPRALAQPEGLTAVLLRKSVSAPLQGAENTRMPPRNISVSSTEGIQRRYIARTLGFLSRTLGFVVIIPTQNGESQIAFCLSDGEVCKPGVHYFVLRILSKVVVVGGVD